MPRPDRGWWRFWGRTGGGNWRCSGGAHPAVGRRPADRLTHDQRALRDRSRKALVPEGFPRAPVFDPGRRFLPVAAQERRQRSEEHTSELQSRQYLVCRLLLEKKKKNKHHTNTLRT